MPNKSEIVNNISKLKNHISQEKQKKLFFLVFLSFFASILEILSVGAILPFVSVLTNPILLSNNWFFKPIFLYFGLLDTKSIVMTVTFVFVVTIIFATISRVLMHKLSIRLAFSIGVDLSSSVYKKNLYQPYIYHIKTNSSEIINAITVKVSEVIFYVIIPVVTIMSSFLSLIALSAVLFYMMPGSAALILLFLAFFYIIVIKYAKNKLKYNSDIIAFESNQSMKNLQEGMGGIREIIIDNVQEKYADDFKEISKKLRLSQGTNQIISIIPRFMIEAIAMLFIVTLALIMSNESGGVSRSLPTLAAIAIGMQRLLPIMQQLYTSITTIHGSQSSLIDVLALLEKNIDKSFQFNESHISKEVTFFNEIKLSNITFLYSDKIILNRINLIIKKGERIGIIGNTGSGKSTLIDLIMGLLHPSSGLMTVDGLEVNESNSKGWQKNIAHVPQDIYLSDSSIERNIAFGVSEHDIDFGEVRKSAEAAQILDIIESLPEKFKTKVGERGVQLSGGQKQRIGIARALYKKSHLIVLDEATSALDNETEKLVMDAIENIDKSVTVLIIAHRLSTLKQCDKIIELDKGTIKRICSYENINLKSSNYPGEA